jgi:hypothetical protein
VVLAVDYGQGVSDAWATVATFIPKLLAFYYAILLFTLSWSSCSSAGSSPRRSRSSSSVAFGVFGPNPISDYLGAVIGYLPKLFAAILILVIAAAVAAAVKGLIENTVGGLSYGKILANAASVLILVIGVVAALNELQIATAVVNAVLYAALAAIAGIVIVAVGGGGIRPMQQRWERALTRYDEEKPRIAEQARRAPSARQQAEQAYAQAQPGTDGRNGSTASDPDYRTI